MKFISTLIFIAFTVAIVNFSLANDQQLALGFWPFEQKITLPVYMWVFAIVLMGFFLGYFASLLSYSQHRNKIRLREKQAKEIEKEAEKLKQEALEITKKRKEQEESK